MAHDQLDHLPGGGTLIASGAYTAAQNSDPVGLPTWTGGIIVDIDVTLDPAAASVTFTVQGQDPCSGAWYTLLASAAIAAVGHTTLNIHPSITTVTANVSAAKCVPEVVRVAVSVADTDSLTYSVGITAVP